VLALGTALTAGQFVNGVPNAAAIAAGYSTPPYATFTGDLAQALRMWPQYQQINWRYFPNGKSHYNALQASFDRRMSQGRSEERRVGKEVGHRSWRDSRKKS